MFDIDESYNYYKDRPVVYILIIIIGMLMGVSTVLFAFTLLWYLRTLLFS